MSLWQMIGLGVVFAVLAAMLFIWGLKKEEDPNMAVERRLLNAAGSKVEKYLRKNETISFGEIETMVKGIHVKRPWSRQVLQVQNTRIFTKSLVKFLLEQQIIEVVGKEVYKLHHSMK